MRDERLKPLRFPKIRIHLGKMEEYDRRRIYLEKGAHIAFMAVAMWIGGAVLFRMFFELKGTFAPDAAIFLAVGRGILNGLTPYTDLFETKPPGIFFLSALSLWWNDGLGIAKIFQAIAIGGIPVGMIFMVEKQKILAFIFGGLLALYVAEYAGEMIPESFGAFLAVIARQKRLRWKGMLFSSFLLLAAISMKEPFILSIAAGVLVLNKEQEQSLNQKFLISLGLATVMGVFLLFLTGYMKAFFFDYLPHMFFHVRQYDNMVWPALPVRAFFVHKTFWHLWSFSWPFTIVILSLWAWQVHRPLQWLAVTYLTMLAIAMGGDFYPHHFVFAAPLYAALFVSFIEHHTSSFIRIFVMVMLLLGIPSYPARQYHQRVLEWQEREPPLQEAAVIVDRVLDQCGYDRYINLTNKGQSVFGYTKHSPAGPLFAQYSRFIDGNDRYFEEFARNIQRDTHVMVVTDFLDDGFISGDGKKGILTLFGPDPPPCAKNFEQPDAVTVLFRKKVSGST